MHAYFLGKDPESTEGDSPTLFATDRTDRVTYIAQGWRVTDLQVPGRRRPGTWPRDSDRDPRRRAQDVRAPLPAGGGRQLTLIEPGPDFAQLFQSFKHTAFRLETRDRYNSPRG